MAETLNIAGDEWFSDLLQGMLSERGRGGNKQVVVRALPIYFISRSVGAIPASSNRTENGRWKCFGMDFHRNIRSSTWIRVAEALEHPFHVKHINKIASAPNRPRLTPYGLEAPLASALIAFASRCASIASFATSRRIGAPTVVANISPALSTLSLG